jgi:phage terminase small subunit
MQRSPMNAIIQRSDTVPLTPKQDAFCDEYVANGGKGTAAAKAAGYAEASAHVEANRLLKNPLILQEIYKRTAIAIGASAPKALAQIIGLSSTAKSDYVRLEASKDLLDRAGLKAPERVDHRLDGELKISIDLS